MITARLNNQRTSPRKMRLVANLIKGKKAEFALDLLSVTPKRAADPIAKLLKSAIANAKMQGISAETLVVANIRVDGGSPLKRMIPGSRGTGFPIKKRTSKILLTLDEATPRLRSGQEKKIEAPASAKATAGKPKTK